MNKYLWFACIGIFIVVTALVLALDDTQSRRVSFSNQDFAINNETNEFVDNSGTNIHFTDSKIQNKSLAKNNSSVKFNSSKLGMSNTDTSLNNSSSFGNNDVKISDNSSYSNQKTDYKPATSKFDNQRTDYSSSSDYQNQDFKVEDRNPIKYKKLDSSKLDQVMKDVKNVSTEPVDYSNKPFRQMNKYGYKNIDWSTWKSNFVNRILDDSENIRSLDAYQDGAWFYYSFDVSDEGAISNVVVKSVYLKESDKMKIRELINNYAYQEITVFPMNSKRDSAHVSAVMVLTTEETQHSNPADFNDYERIKIKY